jgi:four helix bundle protein
VVGDRKRPGSDIAERLLELAAMVVRIANELPRTAVSRHIALQLVRSATSAGANYQEARRAESRADFVHKVGVAAKEESEALYWLLLIDRLGTLPDEFRLALREADELTAILVASGRTARQRP